MKRREDLGDWPVVSTSDWRALFWLIVFFGLFVAICAVADPTTGAGR